ncbi:MAG: hypothetical protein ABEH35_07250 [Haloarculaceae archaeon]
MVRTPATVLSPVLDLAATLALSLVPTLLFLGLWRGLMWLRDDALVEEARRMQAREAQLRPGRPIDVDAAADVDVCSACGSRNPAGMTHCWNCLGDLNE